MNKAILVFGAIIIFFLQASGVVFSASNEGKDSSFELVHLNSLDGQNTSEAAFFPMEGRQAVIFAPGLRYGKESWYFLAELLQKKKIASLSTGGSSADILRAISFLKKRGFDKISLVGGSMGGESVLDILKEDIDKSIDKAVLLAPFGGDPIKDSRIHKLFIVARKDGVVGYSDIQALYRNSSEPKKIKVYEKSRAHAQELLASKRTKENVTNLIVDFIHGKQP